MKRKSLLYAGTCALVFAPVAFWSSAASAQAYVDPPQNILADDNGVDLSSGAINYQLVHQLDALDPDMQPYMRFWMGTGFRDTMMMTLTRPTVGGNYTVSVGAQSEVFQTADAVTFAPVQHRGSTLTRSGANYIYTDARGVVFTFDPTMFGGLNAYRGVIARVTRIDFPSGAVATLNYQFLNGCNSPCSIHFTMARLMDVNSSSGFSYKFQYASDIPDEGNPPPWLRLTRVTRYNKAIDYCAPAANSCSFSTPWPYIQYGETQVASTEWEESEADATGNTARLVRTTRNALLSTRRPASPTDSMTVTWNSDVVGQVTHDGLTSTYNFSLACCGSTIMTTTVNRPSGGQIVVVSDQRYGIPKTFQDELQRVTTYTFDAYQNMTRVQYPLGNAIQYTYDDRGNRTSRTAISRTPGTPADVTTYWVFPATCVYRATCNQATSVIDPKGGATDYVYDPVHGGLLTETRPAPVLGAVRPQTRHQYAQYQAYFKDSSGNIVASGAPTWVQTGVFSCRTGASCSGTADETRTLFDFGPQTPGVANNLLPQTLTRSAGDNSIVAVTVNSYDQNGWLSTIDGPIAGNSDLIRYRYDAAGRTVGAIGPDPDGAGPLLVRATRTTFNADGQPTLIEKGTVADQSDAAWNAFASLQQRRTAYDSAGRKIQESLSAGGTTYDLTQISYDLAGRPECAAVRMNPAVFSSLPASACQLWTAGVFGSDRISKRSYDLAGQMTGFTSALGTADESVEQTRTYTANGQLSTLTDGEGNMTSYGYDGLDRLAGVYFPSAARGSGVSDLGNYESFWYDPNGNRTTLQNRAGQTISYTFDALNRMTFKDLPGAEPDVTYGYDNYGNVISATQPGMSLAFTWDALGHLLTDSGPDGTLTSSYDSAGRRSRLAYTNGYYVDYDYLNTGDVSAIRENGATSGAGVLASYSYDDLGRRIGISRGNGATTTYGYNPQSQLITMTHDLAGTAYDVTFSYAYNPAEQIVSRTSSNDVYSWTGHGNGTTTYGVNGLNQMTAVGANPVVYDSKGNMTSEGGRSFSYSSENLLTGVTNGYTQTWSYDPLMRRFNETTVGVTYSDYLFDGGNLVEEVRAGAAYGWYVHGPGADEPMLMRDSRSRKWWSILDERNTVIGWTNPDGTISATYNFDEYGKPGNTARFGFAGKPWHGVASLYYSNARMYDPKLGIFVQSDPIGYEGGMNLYGYVKGDPINRRDPRGLKACPKDDKKCIDDPGTEQPGPEQKGPDGPTQQKDDIVITASKKRRLSDGTPINLEGPDDLEQGFRVDTQKIVKKDFTHSGSLNCDDGTSSAANTLNIDDLAPGESAGHTHGGLNLNPLPGQEDGLMAAATHTSAYVISRRGAFAVERTVVGFRVRQLAGDPLNSDEISEVRALIGRWNQHGGGSGKKCTFTPNAAK